MNGWNSLPEPAFPLQQSFQCLRIVVMRERLKPAPWEDCVNNVRAGERQDGIYGPDPEIRLLFRGEAFQVWGCNVHPGSRELMSLNEINGPVMLSTCYFKTSLKTAHWAHRVAAWKEEGGIWRANWKRNPLSENSMGQTEKWVSFTGEVALGRSDVRPLTCSMAVLLGKKPCPNCSILRMMPSILS